MSRRCAASLALLALALGAAGCGSEDPVRARDRTIAIALDDFTITPQTVRARPGPLTVDLVNRGRIGHNFRLRRGGANVRKVSTLLPGARLRVRVRKLSRGGFTMYCGVANHEELGMYGTLTVR
jgi:plastocyanin